VQQCGSVWQCVQQFAAVRAPVCGSARGSVRQQYGSVLAVRAAVYAAVRATMYGSVRGCRAVRQCVAVVQQCAAVRQCQCGITTVCVMSVYRSSTAVCDSLASSVQQCARLCAAVCAAVCSSARGSV
jgi:prephenate dehydratase